MYISQTASAPFDRGGVEPAHICGDVVPRAQVGAAALPGQAARRAAAAHSASAADAAVPAEEFQQSVAAATSTNII